MSYTAKQMEFVFHAFTDVTNVLNGDKVRNTRVLGEEKWDAGIVDNVKFDASNGASPARAPHLYVSSNGADAVTINTMHEDGARLTYTGPDGREHVETMRRGYHIGPDMVLNEYARNTLDGARVYRTVSVGTTILETSVMHYPGASVETLYSVSARRVKLATTRNGAFKPRKVSHEDVVRMFARGIVSACVAIAAEHGTDGTHFSVTPHVHNSGASAPDVVHDNARRAVSMSGAQRRKLRKLRRAAQANN